MESQLFFYIICTTILSLLAGHFYIQLLNARAQLAHLEDHARFLRNLAVTAARDRDTALRRSAQDRENTRRNNRSPPPYYPKNGHPSHPKDPRRK